MSDMEKVKKGLRDLRRYIEDREWSDNREDRQAAKVYWRTVTDAIELLKERDTKHGKWRYCEDVSGQDGYQCSECGFFEPWYYEFENHNFITDYQFCPSCGSLMQEGR